MLRHRRWRAGLALAFCLCCLFFIPSAAQAARTVIPSFTAVRAQHSHSDQELLDRHGVLLQQTRINWQQRQGKWLALEAISPAVVQLLLYAEDRRFYAHHGVDWYAVAGSVWSSAWGRSLRGTSTITMQLVDLLGLGAGRVAGQRSWQAKWQQARLAQQLERQWSKAQIIEAYLNLVPFRGELIGVDAMARVLWQKQAFALSLPEAALAVAMLPSPNAPPERLQQRSCMLWQGVAPQADCTARRWHHAQALKRLAQPAWGNPQAAPHAARFMGQFSMPTQQRSSLDKVLQLQAQRIMQQHLLGLKANNAHDAALLVLHNATGEVMVYVGSSAHSQAAQFDHVQAKRQAGSTLKPFLYQLAIAQKRITAASLLADTSAQFSTPYGVYVPQNYDEQFMGWLSARVALAASINIPAVRLLAQVGVDDFHQYLQQLGFELPYNADYYGLGLALGSAEVSLWQLSNAYRSLANLGRFSSACLQVDCEQAAQQQVASEGATWIIQHILADNTARAVTFGLDSALNTPFWTAVKTGTSKDMRDNWAVGFSTNYTVGVWVGNTDGSAMHDVSGVSGAAPIWQDMMRFLQTYSAQPERAALAQPTAVVCVPVAFMQHTEPPRQECFLEGTQRTEIVLAARAAEGGRITAPPHQSIYALDPDIAVAQQRVLLRSDAQSDEVLWRVNGVVLANTVDFALPLAPGQYRIELVSASTHAVLDTVAIEVQR